MNYPKATCDPGTEALRLANERADRWKQRHDALAARLASVDALADEWEGWANGRSTTRIDAFRDAAESLRAVLGSDAHTEPEGVGTGTGGGSDPAQTEATPWDTRSGDRPEDPPAPTPSSDAHTEQKGTGR